MTLVTLCHFPLELVEEVFEEHDVVLSLFGYRNPLAHPRGYAHRDLKPANILFTKAGNKLLDLGLAKLATGRGTHAPARGFRVCC